MNIYRYIFILVWRVLVRMREYCRVTLALAWRPHRKKLLHPTILWRPSTFWWLENSYLNSFVEEGRSRSRNRRNDEPWARASKRLHRSYPTMSMSDVSVLSFLGTSLHYSQTSCSQFLLCNKNCELFLNVISMVEDYVLRPPAIKKLHTVIEWCVFRLTI